MAKKDVREYLYQMGKQFAEMKSDLADYDEAFRNGFITEDKLEELKSDCARLGENYNRLLYVNLLLDLPNKKEKKKRMMKANKDVFDYMDSINASERAVVDENRCILKAIKDRLADLTKKGE